jgi:signal transduction histidine kinase
VEDDGPGISEHEIEMVLTRGDRLDESKPGSGLGLAIVGDLAEIYGGSLSLERSPLSGLAIELRPPMRGESSLMRPASPRDHRLYQILAMLHPQTLCSRDWRRPADIQLWSDVSDLTGRLI